MNIIAPHDNSVVASLELATQDQANTALLLASKTQKEWKKVPLAAKIAIVEAAIAEFNSSQDAIATELALLIGRCRMIL